MGVFYIGPCDFREMAGCTPRFELIIYHYSGNVFITSSEFDISGSSCRRIRGLLNALQSSI
jgi:hypothetical protein